MMEFLLDYQWEIFIVIEVISLVSLLLFGVVRYFLDQRKTSLLFLIVFIALVALEAVLAVVIYQETGEISTFQIVITIFVIYACTFGIFDFKKLDRWMRKKIGNWRGVQLLTDKDIDIMKKQKNPQYIARKYRYSSIAHLIVFVIVQLGFWFYGTGDINRMLDYVLDLSWIGTENVTETPYANETMYGISMVWGIVFIIDFLYSWSYTIFPANSKG